MKIYYAHCISLYNTQQEARDMDMLKALFPEAEIYNPNNPECSQGYKERGMRFFHDLIDNEKFNVVAFRGLPNGKIPAGVWSEITYAQLPKVELLPFIGQNVIRAAIPVIELPCYTDRQMTVDDTRFYLKEAGFR